MLEIFKHTCNSRMQLGEIYFWTDTIKDWKYLLKQDKYKQIIIDTWKKQVLEKYIRIYAFVIMPNHLHVIWELLKMNGKEMPHASFNKATGHLITKDLKINHIEALPYFKVEEKERAYRIWQRDPLAVVMDSKLKLEQKIDYIHNNPLQEKWNLAKKPESYIWSSASFYETGKDNFGLLTHYMDRIS